MLHLLTGKDRVVLSEHLLVEICQKAKMGHEGQILVVPEQFSHEAERRLCMYGGDTISRYCEVLSPSRLADRVAAYSGGIARTYLDYGGRLLAMALAAEQVSSRIKLYAAMLRRPEFLVNMISMIDEFQSYCLLPDGLRQASAKTEGQFSQKLEELALLYEAYLAVCSNGKADPAGKLLWLEETLSSSDWAQGRTFYFDGFSDFTVAEFAVLQQFILQSENTWITLCVDMEKPHVSASAIDTVLRLERFVKQYDVSMQRIVLNRSVQRNAAVQGLLDHLFISDKAVLEKSERIELSVYQSVEEECQSCAIHAKKLLHGGARCREIAIACTDPELYDAPLRAVLNESGLPVYYAGKDNVLNKPVFHSILMAMQAAVGPMDYEDVALYLKSGLPLLERDRCDRLDCYAYQWNLYGMQWERSWELHPRGFGETWLPEDGLVLEDLNRDKDSALAPLFQLRRDLLAAHNTGEMVLACYRFLEAIQLRQRLEHRANDLGGQLGQELLQIHDVLCDSLEQTWMILCDTVRSPDDFVKLYRSVLSQYHIATIPAGIDQIYVGSLQDLRSKNVPHILILGASDGSFPSYKVSEGLLTEEERKELLSRGVSLAPTRADQMDREMSHIYAALSAATESIWLSYAGDQPAWLFRRAASLFPNSVHVGSGDLFLDIRAYAAWRLRHEDDSPVEMPELQKWEEALRQLRDYQFTPLKEETVQGLYGKQIYLSASRIDKFAACRFAFFLAYGLKALPRKQAKLDASAFGTFVHEVLEKTVLRVNDEGGFRSVSEDRLVQIATDEINTYAATHFPKQAQRDAYLFQRSQSEIMDIVVDLGDELRHSMFEPVSCELEFSAVGSMPAFEVSGNDASCKISGFVDRVDLYERDGTTYVRVVDYKTGHKDFDYTDILNGAGLQMLIYLFALKSYGGKFYNKQSLSPAGVLYLPARKEYTLTDPLPADDVVDSEHQNERRRRGLISSSPELLAAMEHDPEKPRFMPYQMGKNGLTGNVADERQMCLLERHVLRTLAHMTDRIASGVVKPDPIVRGQDSSCRFCDYRSVCHMDLCARDIRPMAATSADKFWEKLEQEENGHG